MRQTVPSITEYAVRAFMLALFSLFLCSAPSGATESPIIRNKMNNGVVLLIKSNDRSNIVAISVVLRVSVYDEGEQKVGARALMADLLLEKICSETTPGGIRTMELMGAMTSAETTPDYMIFNFQTTPRHYKRIIELIAQCFKSPVFDEALFKKEKSAFIDRIKGGKGAFSTIYGIFLQNFYHYHPYKLSEEINAKGLEATPKEKLEEFLRSKLSADRIVLSISGNISTEDTKTLVEKHFSGFVPQKTSRVEVQWEPRATEKEIFLSSLSKMSWLILGFPAPSYGSPDYPAMKVLSTILGEGLNSRLWVELREKRGLAYELGSYYPELEGPSHVLTYVITQPQNVILSRRLITAEIEKIKTQGVTQKEVADAKEKIYGGTLLSQESSKGKAAGMAIAEVIGGPYSLDLTMDRKIENVTVEDVKRVINIHFVEPTLLVVRPPGHFYIDWFK